jgi:hypothetical protein
MWLLGPKKKAVRLRPSERGARRTARGNLPSPTPRERLTRQDPFDPKFKDRSLAHGARRGLFKIAHFGLLMEWLGKNCWWIGLIRDTLDVFRTACRVPSVPLRSMGGVDETKC